jgi:hypothetical protein
MSADVLRLLHEADPAASIPDDDAVRREDLRRSILSSSTAGPDVSRLVPRRPTRRRVAILLVVALVAVASACATVAATRLLRPSPAHFGTAPAMPVRHPLLTLRQARTQYRIWQHKLALPPGATWDRIVVPKKMRDDTWGGNAGVLMAFDQAIGKWCSEWIAADAAHDDARASAAAGALTRLTEIMPIWREGMSENDGAYDQSTVDQLRGAITSAEAGDLNGIRGFTSLVNAGL